MTGERDIVLAAAELQAFYNAHFSYYTTLDEGYRALFTGRCLQFISEKKISGAEGFGLTNRVKALVAASAVQLTLGLETWSLDYFEMIVIYPAAFENEASGLMHKGETNMAGYIRLSWKSFNHGYSEADDNINLGLHEFSHALRFNGIRGADQDYFFEHYFNSWLALAYEAYADIRNNRTRVFRKYGGANINEFISVCIEHYFESPDEIKAHYPLLYYATAILLNQETTGGHTRLDIRHELLDQRNALLPGLSPQQFKTQMRQSPFFTTTLICFSLLVFVSFIAGPFSGPAYFFFAIWLIAYLRFDYRFMHILLGGKKIQVQKGLFVFKGLRKKELPVSSIVSFARQQVSGSVTEWKIVFYNQADQFFYEETVHASTALTAGFIKELALNKIASLKQ